MRERPELPFLQAIEQRVVLFDGGTGTTLYDRGVFLNQNFEQLNLTNPEIVESVHRAFLQAGAECIETNTFSASRTKLETHGLGDRVREINAAAARIARRCAGRHAYVGGSIGPLGIRLEPWGPTSVSEAVELFREQVEGLAEEGVDLLVLETFTDLVEIRAALDAVNAVCDLPIVALMTVNEEGRTPEGVPPEWIAQKLEESGADVVGINCSVGPAPMMSVVETMAGICSKPLAALPNAGTPRGVDGRMLYLTSPLYMGRYARRFARIGARVVGGCCGVSPEHIRSMRVALGDRYDHESVPHVTVVPPKTLPSEPVPQGKRSELGRKLADGELVTLIEVPPPRGWDLAGVTSEIRAAASAGLDAALILDDPRHVGHMSPISFAKLISEMTADDSPGGRTVEPMLQFMARDRRLPSVMSDLLGAHALGVRNVMLTTGRAPRPGEATWESPQFEVDAIGLTNVVTRLNHGLDVGDNPIGAPTSFVAAVLATIEAPQPDDEFRRLEWKIDAGADLIVTSPIFDIDKLTTFLASVESIRVPVIATVVPLRSLREAEYLASEVPGVSVPDQILAEMSSAGIERGAESGLEIARRTLDAIRPHVEGVVLGGARSLDRAAWELLGDWIGNRVTERRSFPGRPGFLKSAEESGGS